MSTPRAAEAAEGAVASSARSSVKSASMGNTWGKRSASVVVAGFCLWMCCSSSLFLPHGRSVSAITAEAATSYEGGRVPQPRAGSDIPADGALRPEEPAAAGHTEAADSPALFDPAAAAADAPVGAAGDAIVAAEQLDKREAAFDYVFQQLEQQMQRLQELITDIRPAVAETSAEGPTEELEGSVELFVGSHEDPSVSTVKEGNAQAPSVSPSYWHSGIRAAFVRPSTRSLFPGRLQQQRDEAEEEASPHQQTEDVIGRATFPPRPVESVSSRDVVEEHASESSTGKDVDALSRRDEEEEEDESGDSTQVAASGPSSTSQLVIYNNKRKPESLSLRQKWETRALPVLKPMGEKLFVLAQRLIDRLIPAAPQYPLFIVQGGQPLQQVQLPAAPSMDSVVLPVQKGHVISASSVSVSPASPTAASAAPAERLPAAADGDTEGVESGASAPSSPAASHSAASSAKDEVMKPVETHAAASAGRQIKQDAPTMEAGRDARRLQESTGTPGAAGVVVEGPVAHAEVLTPGKPERTPARDSKEARPLVADEGGESEGDQASADASTVTTQDHPSTMEEEQPASVRKLAAAPTAAEDSTERNNWTSLKKEVLRTAHGKSGIAKSLYGVPNFLPPGIDEETHFRQMDLIDDFLERAFGHGSSLSFDGFGIPPFSGIQQERLGQPTPGASAGNEPEPVPDVTGAPTEAAVPISTTEAAATPASQLAAGSPEAAGTSEAAGSLPSAAEAAALGEPPAPVEKAVTRDEHPAAETTKAAVRLPPTEATAVPEGEQAAGAAEHGDRVQGGGPPQREMDFQIFGKKKRRLERAYPIERSVPTRDWRRELDINELMTFESEDSVGEEELEEDRSGREERPFDRPSSRRSASRQRFDEKRQAVRDALGRLAPPPLRKFTRPSSGDVQASDPVRSPQHISKDSSEAGNSQSSSGRVESSAGRSSGKTDVVNGTPRRIVRIHGSRDTRGRSLDDTCTRCEKVVICLLLFPGVHTVESCSLMYLPEAIDDVFKVLTNKCGACSAWGSTRPLPSVVSHSRTPTLTGPSSFFAYHSSGNSAPASTSTNYNRTTQAAASGSGTTALSVGETLGRYLEQAEEDTAPGTQLLNTLSLPHADEGVTGATAPAYPAAEAAADERHSEGEAAARRGTDAAPRSTGAEGVVSAEAARKVKEAAADTTAPARGQQPLARLSEDGTAQEPVRLLFNGVAAPPRRLAAVDLEATEGQDNVLQTEDDSSGEGGALNTQIGEEEIQVVKSVAQRTTGDKQNAANLSQQSGISAAEQEVDGETQQQSLIDVVGAGAGEHAQERVDARPQQHSPMVAEPQQGQAEIVQRVDHDNEYRHGDTVVVRAPLGMTAAATDEQTHPPRALFATPAPVSSRLASNEAPLRSPHCSRRNGHKDASAAV